VCRNADSANADQPTCRDNGSRICIDQRAHGNQRTDQCAHECRS
jgi:hypothetical protein